nr:uncharacterized protein LOC112544372 [Pelodiscus sinensis]|eukprot:XP_025036244.1 uncharacterized protein LOC112544372 [Pelodiscus sinensis]
MGSRIQSRQGRQKRLELGVEDGVKDTKQKPSGGDAGGLFSSRSASPTAPMLLSLCLLLPALSPSSQEICSAPGALPAPTLHFSQMSARPGDSVRLQCSVIIQAPSARIVFCEDGKEVSSQRGLLGKLTYDSHPVVSGSSSPAYSCGYEIKDSDNRVNRSQLSPAQRLRVTGAIPAPTLFLNQTSARPGDSVWLQCSLFSWAGATRIVFYKDGEEVSSQRSLLGKLTYDYDHAVSGNSSGNFACGYEIKDSDSRVTRSQLSPAQHLSVTGKAHVCVCLSAQLCSATVHHGKGGEQTTIQ